MSVIALPHADRRWNCADAAGTHVQRMVLSSHRGGPGRSAHTVVSARGDIDASNAKEFAVAVCELAGVNGTVTLDLSALNFLAVDGFAALHAVNAHLTRAGVFWAVLPGPAVRRVLQLCDPAGVIPVSTDGPRLYAVRSQAGPAAKAQPA